MWNPSQRCICFNEPVFHRVQTFPRAQILQEFNFHCLKLAENDNRGFKIEFEVRSDACKPDRLLLGPGELNCSVKKKAFCFVKELNEVGTDLSKVAGDSEPNRQKNRYPYILPCESELAKQEPQNVLAFIFVCF